MTEAHRPEPDVLPPEPGGALSVPPPVPQKKPGFLRRLFTSRKKQQAVAMQNGYLEMVDLIRAIRSHLDRQETVQTSVLTMLEKVPGAMDRQHEVMTMFKQQLENGMENNRRLTDSMGNLNNTLAAMDESQKASSRTITDLIHRSRESEQLLREVMRRSERRMTALVIFFFLAVVALGFYFVRGANRPAAAPAAEPVSAVVAEPTEPAPAPAAQTETPAPPAEKAEFVPPAEPAAEKTAEIRPAPAKKNKFKHKAKAQDAPPPPAEPVAAPAADEPVLGQPDLTLEQLQPALDAAAPAAAAPVTAP
jgi:hypothetical protein